MQKNKTSLKAGRARSGFGKWDACVIWKQDVYASSSQQLWASHETMETNTAIRIVM